MPYIKDGIKHYYMWERVREGLIDLSQDLTSAALNVTKQRDDNWDWRPTGEQTDALITRLNIGSTVCMDLARAVDRNLRDRDVDALLALADEMETADPEDLDVAIDYVTECASRIRQAIGG